MNRMTSTEIRDIIEQFLALVCRGEHSEASNLAALRLLTDQLALASNYVQVPEGDGLMAGPDWAYEERRELASQYFPELGYYNIAAAVTENVSESELMLGDAIDDLADIAGDLEGCRWLWANVGELEALQHFRFWYDHHWGTHLRELQYCLHSLASGR